MKCKICQICEKCFVANSQSNVCSLQCRILEGVEKKENGCWEWQRSKAGDYGKVRWKGKTISSHRASYIAFREDVPKGLCVCHSCDNPICVNPDHLWLGTHLENARDRVIKGRQRGTEGVKWTEEWRAKIIGKRKSADRKGEKHHLVKLDNEKVLQIKELLKYKIKQSTIASRFGISQSHVSHIKSGRLWPHLNEGGPSHIQS